MKKPVGRLLYPNTGWYFAAMLLFTGRRGRAVYPCGRRAVRHAHHVYHQPRKAFPAQAAADELRADGDGFRRHFRPRGLCVPDGGHPAAGK